MRTVLTIWLTLLPTLTGAAIYKWVDGEGNVVYSERQPVGTEFQQIRESRPSLEAESASPGTEAELSPEPTSGLEETTADAEESAAEDLDSLFRTNCQVARRNLSLLEISPNVIYTDSEGQQHLLEEPERAARIGQAKSEIELYCK